MSADGAALQGLGAVSADVLGVCAFGLEAARYLGRKVERAKRTPSEPSEGPPDTVTLVGAIDGTNYLRKFSVLIDQAKVGYIGPGEVRHFHVSPVCSTSRLLQVTRILLRCFKGRIVA